MNQSISRKRPWLAALLAALATGLGHLYLRRWRRALGWLVALIAVSVLFVDPAVLEATATGASVDLLSRLPLLVVGGLSILDAYLLAHAQNQVVRPAGAQTGDPHCPNCGRELDTDLEFCHWCTAEIGDLEGHHVDRAES